jgi:hypothetical protein
MRKKQGLHFNQLDVVFSLPLELRSHGFGVVGHGATSHLQGLILNGAVNSKFAGKGGKIDGVSIDSK